MSGKRSILWEYFTEVENKIAVCKTCNSKISYKTSVSHLRSHMQHRHPEVVLPKGKKSASEENPPVVPVLEDNKVLKPNEEKEAEEGNRDSDYAVHRVFVSRCSIAHMQNLCPSTEQIPELFTYLNQESENMTALYNQATILSKRFFFSIGSFKLMWLFYVKINLLNWKDGSISPNDVTVVNKIGHTRDSEIQAVLNCTKKDENFLPNFFVGVHHLMKQLENLEDNVLDKSS